MAIPDDDDDFFELGLTGDNSLSRPRLTVPPLQDEQQKEEEGDDAIAFAESQVNWQRRVPMLAMPWMQRHKFTQVHTVEQVNAIVDRCISAGFCALDLETEGLDNRIKYDAQGKPRTIHQIVGFCISYDGVEGFYIPVRHVPEAGDPDLNVRPVAEVEAAIARLCSAAIPEGTEQDRDIDHLSYKSKRPQLVIGFWNAQFDQEFLYPITGIDWWHPSSFECGMLASFCLYSDDKIGLKGKAKQLLKDSDGNPYEMIELKQLFYGRKRNLSFAKLAPDEPGVLNYAGSDAICTYLLCRDHVVPAAQAKHSSTYRLEKQVSCVMRVLERNRVRVLRDEARVLLEEQLIARDKLLSEIKAFANDQCQIDLEPGSPKQLSAFLFGPRPKGLDISPKPEENEKSGQYKTDAATLSELASLPGAPIILKQIVEFREAEKLCGTYLQGLVNNPDENDCLRVSLKQTGAASGRFSAPAGDPEQGYAGIPLHGIPDALRRCFAAREGYTMFKADYAGEELRIAANVSGETVWINEFLHGDGDLHSITARALFNKQQVTKEERKAGKVANFSLLYGGGAASLVRATGCDRVEAQRRKNAFDKSVPKFTEWCHKQHKLVKAQKGVITAFGRWIAIPDANDEDRAVRAACERYSTNYVIQGSGADILKIALILLHKKFDRRRWLRGNGGDDSVRMLLNVHDEIVFEVRHDRVADAMPIIVETMESPGRLAQNPSWQVPLVVEPLVGFNWSSGFKVERSRPDHPCKPYEVDLKGYRYSVARDAKTDGDGNVIEEPDRQERLVGKRLWVIDPPWLPAGTAPMPPSNDNNGTPQNNNSAGAPAPEPGNDVTAAAPSEPTHSAPVANGNGHSKSRETIAVSLLVMTRNSIDIVADAAWACHDADGSYVYLTSPDGADLILPGSKVRVSKRPFLNLLARYNLIHSENDYAST